MIHLPAKLSHLNDAADYTTAILTPKLITLPTKKNDEVDETFCKFAAECLLINRRPTVMVPTKTEWIGLNLLDRDGELSFRRDRKTN